MSVTRINRHLRSDRGATALLIAMSMLVLIGLASLAVDLGLAINERRQDQAAADVGALAALQFAQPNPGCSGAGCFTQTRANGANAAISVANASLDDPSLADWSNAALCGSPPGGFSVTAVSPCVAFTGNFERAWIKIPTIASPTFFAKLLGADQVNVSAFAIADQVFGNSGPVLPFFLPVDASTTDYTCLKVRSDPSWGSCGGSSDDKLGWMDFSLYGNPDRNTTQRCNGDADGRLVSNIARGVDHPLGTQPTGSGPGTGERNNCPNLGAEPDMARDRSGDRSAIENGLFYEGSLYSLDGNPYDGRIQDGSGVRVRDGVGVRPDVDVDDLALWSYLRGGLPGPACSGSINTPPEMLACIAWAKSTGTEIFSEDIVESPRFAFAPEVAAPSGPQHHIIGHRPIFLDSIFFGCDDSRCEIMHTPDVADSGPCPVGAEFITCGTPGDHSERLAAMTAYVLSPNILPDIAKSPGPGDPGQRRYNLSG